MEHIETHDDAIAALPSVAPVASVAKVRSFGSFTAWSMGTVAAGAILLIAFVMLVDPYRLFGFIDAEGFNRIKPSPEQYREEIKVSQAIATRPTVLLMGNSRVEVGLDPESASFASKNLSAYNLALAGTNLTTSQHTFEQLHSKLPLPATAVIGVEFLDFLTGQGDKASFAQPPIQANKQSLSWRIDTVFSLKAVLDAVRTISIQKNPEVETLTSRGHTPLLEYRKYARQEGYHAIFQQRAQENARNVMGKPHHLFATATGSSESIDRLRDLLGTMVQDGTEVHLVIYPYHAQLMAMFEEAGLQPLMEEWKSILVREVEAVKSRKPSAKITLWDFSGFSPIQCERIPAPGDLRSVTQWYWEAGHFKSTTGNLMLRRMLGDESLFGVALTSGNLEQNRQRVANEHSQCLRDYPEVFAQARSVIENIRRQAH